MDSRKDLRTPDAMTSAAMTPDAMKPDATMQAAMTSAATMMKRIFPTAVKELFVLDEAEWWKRKWKRKKKTAWWKKQRKRKQKRK